MKKADLFEPWISVFSVLMQRCTFRRVQCCVLICMLVFTEVSRSYFREGSNPYMLLFSAHHSSAVAEYYNKRLSSKYSGYDHFHLISCLFS